MSASSLVDTVPLTEQIVANAWATFVAGTPPFVSVGAFLSWLGDAEPEILRFVDESELIALASNLQLLAVEQSPGPPLGGAVE